MSKKKYHECEALANEDIISVQKINGRWCWVFWDYKKGNQAHEISFCPYCGENLNEPRTDE